MLFRVFAGKEFVYECPNGDQVVSVSPVYVTHDVHGDLHPDGSEGSEVKYFRVDDLPEKMLPQVRGIIESFLKSSGM